MYGEKQLCTVQYSLRGEDGNDISIGETPDLLSVVVCIQQNDDKGRLATVRLSKQQFNSLMDLHYSFRFDGRKEVEGQADPPPPATQYRRITPCPATD